MNKKTLFATISLIIVVLGSITSVKAEYLQFSSIQELNDYNALIPPEQSRTGPTPPV